MKTDFEYSDISLFGPVAFRPNFNKFESISANQAWSLFFTAGREDKALGFNPAVGEFFNSVIAAVVVAGILWSFTFRIF